MFKMGCSMARKILTPGSGSSSNSGQDQLTAGGGGGNFSSTSSASSAPQKADKRRPAPSGAGENNATAGARQTAIKTASGDELNDFSKLQDDPRLPLNVRQIFKITKSWKAIARTMSRTGTAMFLNLFEQNQDLFYLFDRFQHLKGKELHESMELREHAATVMSTLDQSINTLSDYDNFVSYLHSIGQLHHKVPGFKREYFWEIEQPFMKAIKQTLDERCNETIEQIYMIAIKLIIETIAEGYGKDDDNSNSKQDSGRGPGGGGGGSGAGSASDGKSGADSELTRRHKQSGGGGRQENSNDGSRNNNDNFAGSSNKQREECAGHDEHRAINGRRCCQRRPFHSSAVSVTYGDGDCDGDGDDSDEDGNREDREEAPEEVIERQPYKSGERDDNCLREDKLDNLSERQQSPPLPNATNTVRLASGQQENQAHDTKTERRQLKEAVLVRATCKLMKTTSILLDRLDLCQVDSNAVSPGCELIYDGSEPECCKQTDANGCSERESGGSDKRAGATRVGADSRKLLANLNELLIDGGAQEDWSPGSGPASSQPSHSHRSRSASHKSADSLSLSAPSSLPLPLSSSSIAAQSVDDATSSSSDKGSTANRNNGINNNNNNNNRASDNNLIKTGQQPGDCNSANAAASAVGDGLSKGATGANRSHPGYVEEDRKCKLKRSPFDCCPVRNVPSLKPRATSELSRRDYLLDQPTVAGHNIGRDHCAIKHAVSAKGAGACHSTSHGPTGLNRDLGQTVDCTERATSNDKSLGRHPARGGEGINQRKVAPDHDECNDKCQTVHGRHLASSMAESGNIPAPTHRLVPLAQLCPVLTDCCHLQQPENGAHLTGAPVISGKPGRITTDDHGDCRDSGSISGGGGGGGDLIATKPALSLGSCIGNCGLPEAGCRRTKPKTCTAKPLALSSLAQCPLTAACARVYSATGAQASEGAVRNNLQLAVASQTTRKVASASIVTTKGRRQQAGGVSSYQRDYHCDCICQLSYGNIFHDLRGRCKRCRRLARRRPVGLARLSGGGGGGGLKWPSGPLGSVRCKQAAGRPGHGPGLVQSAASTKGRLEWRQNVNESARQASLSLQLPTCDSLGSFSIAKCAELEITCSGSCRDKEQAQLGEGQCKQESSVGLEQPDLQEREQKQQRPQAQHGRLACDDSNQHDDTANGLHAHLSSRSATTTFSVKPEANGNAIDRDNIDSSSVQSARALLHTSEQAVLKLLLADGAREEEQEVDDDLAPCVINKPAGGRQTPNADLQSDVELGELIRMLLLINRLAFSLAHSSNVAQLKTNAAKPQTELAESAAVTQIEVAGPC